jgi:hypothetical protein
VTAAEAKARFICSELTIVLYAPVRAIFRLWLAFYSRFLPSIAAAEHALFERGCIRQASDVTGLTIAKIQRGL